MTRTLKRCTTPSDTCCMWPARGEDVLAALSELEQMGMTGRGCAAWFRTIDRAVGRTPLPDLVWSGPEMAGAYARDTRRVYEGLLGSTQVSVWASSFARFDGSQAFKILADRMDAVPALDVTPPEYPTWRERHVDAR